MAQVDYFLKLEGAPGESTDSKHKGEIELESWSWGASNAGSFSSGGGGGSGKVSMQDFHFVMKNNMASPKLMLFCANGKHIPSAILTCRKAGEQQQEFLKIKFSDCLVASYQTGGSGGSDILPMDSIALAFSKIETEYKPQKPDGTLGDSILAGWDVKTNAKV